MQFNNENIAVQCRNIMKTYGKNSSKVFALRGINLDIYKSELLMIIGPSGSGKTTFISIMTSLLEADSGSCYIFGKNINNLSDNDKANFRSKYIGFVFQSFNLLPALSAKENVAVALLINGIKRTDALKKAEETLDSVGLSFRYDAKPNELSGGEKQKVAIARALVHNPKLIVCDEPTSSLDHESGKVVMELLRDIVNKEHKILIVVTHDNRIYKYADRMAFMEDGKIIKIDEVK